MRQLVAGAGDNILGAVALLVGVAALAEAAAIGAKGDVAALCASLRDNILDRHWMCGFPDKLVIVTVGDYVVSVYGYTDLVDTFTAKLAAAYPSAKTVSDDPIV